MAPVVHEHPLLPLVRMRVAIDDAIAATENFGYEDVEEGLKVLQTEARRLMQLFDKYYSEP